MYISDSLKLFMDMIKGEDVYPRYTDLIDGTFLRNYLQSEDVDEEEIKERILSKLRNKEE